MQNVMSKENQSQHYMDLENTYSAANYFPIPVVLTKAKGVWAWDVDGKKYLDMMAAYSAVNFGHGNDSILNALKEQADRLAVTSRAFYSDQLGKMLKKACEMTGMDKGLPSNGGVEGDETAIKCARRWGYDIKGIPDNQAEIIVCENNFHGRTTSVVSFSSEQEYKRGFGPLTSGFTSIPYGDAQALEAAITPNTCAFLVEPVQGEGGIIVPPPGYLKRCEEICKQNQVLLIVDEIQSGLGRTGKNFCIEHENVKPDGLILGKALGGGVYPVSLFLGTEEIMQVFNPGSHGSTFGGNALASALGLKALELLEDENLAERSREMGAYMIDGLRRLDSKLIKDIRGIGLWIGLEIDPHYASARTFCERLALNGVLSKETHETVVRLAPPLTIEKDEIDYGLAQVEKTLAELG